MAYTIKVKLGTAATEYYRNVASQLSDLTATNITLCNITNVAATVFLSFTRKDADFNTGAILFGYSVPANGFLKLEGDRRINPDQRIKAYSGTLNAIVLSIDIIGDTGEYTEPL